MLTKNYIQIQYEDFKLKYYIQRQETNLIYNFLYLNNSTCSELCICESFGVGYNNISSDDIYDVIDDLSFYNDRALLFFNNTLYEVDELYVGKSYLLDRKLSNITELKLLKDKKMSGVAILDCMIYPPIYIYNNKKIIL